MSKSSNILTLYKGFYMKKFLTTIILSTIFSISASAEISLFNGKNLDGWNFYLDNPSINPNSIFFVKDGTINILGKPFGYMYTTEKYSDFKLTLEWRYPEKPSNSGVFVFVQDQHKLWPNAVECQLCAGKAGDFVLLGGSDLAEFKCQGKRPAFPVVARSANNVEKPIGQWNKYEIICKNGNITVYLNSVLVNKGSKPMFKNGHIALQSEGDLIQFRNIKLQNLK
jgi:hypothetical protein